LATKEVRGDPFTGEFLVPDEPRFAVDIAQHLVPYLYCAERLGGMRVVEIGCGAGYGAQRLAAAAAQVHAYDRNPNAVAWARQHYRAPNLSYRVEGIDPEAEPAAYDAACNFQVLEHLRRPDPFLRRLRGLLRDGGTLYLTTPNRLTSAGENIYHVHEYTPQELARLLERHFSSVTILGITGDRKFRAYQDERRRSMRRFLRYDPLRLRRLVPRWLLAGLYARLARWVRRDIQGALSPATVMVRPEDFRVDAGEIEACDDIFALCKP